MRPADFRTALTAVLLSFLLVSGSSAQSASPTPRVPSDYDDAVFFFGGRFIEGDFGDAFQGIFNDYEDQYVVGAGYQHFFGEPLPGNQLGVELGTALRFGMGPTGEFWGGAVWQNDGFTLGQLRVSPAFTFGMSAVTGHHGKEMRRAEEEGGTADILFYLGPELNLSMVEHPEVQLFWRLHHRSSAWGTFGNMAGSADTTTVGLRYRF